MAVAQATKSVKKTPATKKSKAAPSHPPYIDMITEALVSLKERTGSSHYAIAKHIEEQQKVKGLPSNFKKLLFNQLKKFVASGKLVKVKNSFKLPSGAGAGAGAAPKKSTSKAKETKTTKKPATATATAKKDAAVVKKKAKVTVTVTKKSPAKKAKVAPAKAKKPKSIKSPAKKPTVVKKTAKTKK